MALIRNLTRYDTADPDFPKRIKQALISTGQARLKKSRENESSGAELARRRMLTRMGLIEEDGSAEDVRQRMIQRRERRGQ